MNQVSFRLRKASRRDCPALLDLIQGIAEYEKMTDQVLNTSHALLRTGFGKQRFFEAVLAEVKKERRWQAAGFALYFYTYSTFTGKPTLYLEDLFVRPDWRGCGLGKALFLHLTKIAAKKGCGRMEWSVLNWNTPAIDFYLKLGSRAMEDWTVYRLDEQALATLADCSTPNPPMP